MYCPGSFAHPANRFPILLQPITIHGYAHIAAKNSRMKLNMTTFKQSDKSKNTHLNHLPYNR